MNQRRMRRSLNAHSCMKPKACATRIGQATQVSCLHQAPTCKNLHGTHACHVSSRLPYRVRDAHLLLESQTPACTEENALSFNLLMISNTAMQRTFGAALNRWLQTSKVENLPRPM